MRRVAARASNKFAIFAHAIRSTKPAAAIKTNSCVEYRLRKDASPRSALVKMRAISVSKPFFFGCSWSCFEGDAFCGGFARQRRRNVTSVSARARSAGTLGSDEIEPHGVRLKVGIFC